MPGEASSQKLSTTLVIKKYDHEKTDTPKLFETLKVKDGVIIERITESTEESKE